MSTQFIFNAYKAMWIFCFFDLPVVKKTDQKRAQKFRKQLLEDGFTMHQFSVYSRHCGSKESLLVHQKRVMGMVPPKGKVSLLSVTDKQYGDILNFWGKEITPSKRQPQQLELL